MKKPKMKSDVAIDTVIKSVRQIQFYAKGNTVADFVEFGKLYQGYKGCEHYDLCVDARYDFDEVVKFIKTYGK